MRNVNPKASHSHATACSISAYASSGITVHRGIDRFASIPPPLVAFVIPTEAEGSWQSFSDTQLIESRAKISIRLLRPSSPRTSHFLTSLLQPLPNIQNRRNPRKREHITPQILRKVRRRGMQQSRRVRHRKCLVQLPLPGRQFNV